MLTRLEWPQAAQQTVIDLSLDRMHAVMKAAAITEDALPRIVHIGGTNGKGSTLAGLAALLRAAGHSVHTYTSPHLHYWNERITFNGHPVTDMEFVRHAEQIKAISQQHNIPLTHFEALTAIALHGFMQHQADYLLLEVGLGGRYDATNVFSYPAACVITPIGLDHQEFLGSSLRAIALEKAGIMRPQVPCIIAAQQNEPLNALQQQAEAQSTPLSVYNKDWRLTKEGSTWHYQSATSKVNLQSQPLKGLHQLQNFACAIATFEALCPQKLSQAIIDKASSTLSWPGRLEQLSPTHPFGAALPRTSTIYLDVAHNSHASQALAAWLEEQNLPPINIACQLTRNRCYDTFLEPLLPHAHRIVVRNAENSSYDKFTTVDQLCNQLQQCNAPLLVCGSHTLVHDVKSYPGRRAHRS